MHFISTPLSNFIFSFTYIELLKFVTEEYCLTRTDSYVTMILNETMNLPYTQVWPMYTWCNNTLMSDQYSRKLKYIFVDNSTTHHNISFKIVM